MSDKFETKDSGVRQEFSTGMVRDTQDDKPRYDLLDIPFLKRWAELMGRGAKKYGDNNWRKASTEEELSRFKASALRHMMQYLEGDTTEDHAAAVAFNLAGAEMVKGKLCYEESKTAFWQPIGRARHLSGSVILPKLTDPCTCDLCTRLPGLASGIPGDVQ